METERLLLGSKFDEKMYPTVEDFRARHEFAYTIKEISSTQINGHTLTGGEVFEAGVQKRVMEFVDKFRGSLEPGKRTTKKFLENVQEFMAKVGNLSTNPELKAAAQMIADLAESVDETSDEFKVKTLELVQAKFQPRKLD